MTSSSSALIQYISSSVQYIDDISILFLLILNIRADIVSSSDIIITVFFDTKRRHDVDNQVPKFLLDSFTESGFIIDDDENHLHSLTLKTGYDKDNPRTEIEIIER